jgi:hypothetical protein
VTEEARGGGAVTEEAEGGGEERRGAEGGEWVCQEEPVGGRAVAEGTVKGGTVEGRWAAVAAVEKVAKGEGRGQVTALAKAAAHHVSRSRRSRCPRDRS